MSRFLVANLSARARRPRSWDRWAVPLLIESSWLHVSRLQFNSVFLIWFLITRAGIAGMLSLRSCLQAFGIYSTIPISRGSMCCPIFYCLITSYCEQAKCGNLHAVRLFNGDCLPSSIFGTMRVTVTGSNNPFHQSCVTQFFGALPVRVFPMH